MASSSGTILITGPNGGLGAGFVTQLLKSPYATTHTSIYAVREPSQANVLKSVLEHAPKSHNYLILPIDLCSLDSVRSFAKDVNARVAAASVPPIQALVLNAGSKDMTSQHFTKDHLERTFAVNYLANFLLTLILLQSMDKAKGRIVYLGSTSTFINSAAHSRNFSEDQKRTLLTTVDKMAKGIEEYPDMNVEKTGERRYSLSKLLMIEWMYELQRRLDADSHLLNIAVVGLDPGWVGGTQIARNSPLTITVIMSVLWLVGHIAVLFWSNPLIRTAAKNGDDLLRICFDQVGQNKSLKAAYVNGAVVSATPKEADDREKQGELWVGSLRLANITEEDTVLENWR